MWMLCFNFRTPFIVFDTDKRTLTKLVLSSAAHLDGVCYLTGNSTTLEGNAFAIAVDNQIQVFSGTGTLLFNLPRMFPVSAYPDIEAAVNPRGSRYYFWYAKDDGIPSIAWSPSRLVTVASNGHILQKTDVPALVPARVQTGTPAVTGLLMPPALLLTYISNAGILNSLRYPGAEDTWRSLRQDKGLPGVLLLSLLSGLPAAVLAWLISRRCGDTRRGQIAWAFGVFWLGGYGVLLLLALRAWPARVTCPNCGRLRVVDRTECEHCGAQFARPRRDGTEIFDEVERAGVR